MSQGGVMFLWGVQLLKASSRVRYICLYMFQGGASELFTISLTEHSIYNEEKQIMGYL